MQPQQPNITPGSLDQPQAPRMTPIVSTPTQSSITDAEFAQAKQILNKIDKAYRSRVVGQENLRTALLVALITNGHVLLESVPGLAKTTAAKTIAEAVDATFSRIQCTPDLLPSDIIGTQIFNYSNSKFETQLGPVHANFVLLDEINRSSAKTQSAMLEAMQEKQVSIGGVVHKMPQPFLVLATQNPIEQEGTYELPEAQLDRFLLKEVIDYPKPEEELEILSRIRTNVFDAPLPVDDRATLDDVKFLQNLAKKVFVDALIKDYIIKINQATRAPGKLIPEDLARYVQYGASPRGAIAFMQVATALALLNDRAYVTPDDVKALRFSVLRHRIILNFEALADDVHSESIIDAIFSAIPTP